MERRKTLRLMEILLGIIVIVGACFLAAFFTTKALQRNRMVILVQGLTDMDPAVRKEAERILAEMGPPAVDSLITALSDEDANIRRGAARILGEIKDGRAVEPLLETLKGQDSALHYWTARSLGKMGTPGVDALTRALSYGNAGGVEAAKALGEIKDPRAVEALIDALKIEYGKEVLRNEAIEALVKIGPPAVEPLISLLGDEREDVRIHAVKALGWIKDSRAVDPLIQALNDDNYYLRREAAHSLGEIGDERAVEPLRALMNKKDEDPDIQDVAKRALESMKAKGVPKH